MSCADGWEPGPNPVAQIIATRTAQTAGAAIAALSGLRIAIPPERFWSLVPLGGAAITAGLSAYFVATFTAGTSFPGAPFLPRLPASAENAIALTFDDGPHPDTTPRLLDRLAEARAVATFFVVGERASAYPALVQRIIADGHALGSHGLRHRTMVLQSATSIAADLEEAWKRIEDAAGVPLLARLLRPPYGFKTWALARTAGRLGWTIAGWSLDPRDYDGVPAAELIRRVRWHAAPQDILLLHERPGSTATLDALPGIVDTCLQRGLTPVTLAAYASP